MNSYLILTDKTFESMIHRWVFRSFLCFWPFILYHKLVLYSKHGTKKMRFLLCSKHRRIRHFDLNCFLYDWLGTEIWCQCFIVCSVHHVHSMGMNRVEECQTIESISLGPHVHHAHVYRTHTKTMQKIQRHVAKNGNLDGKSYIYMVKIFNVPSKSPFLPLEIVV